MKISVIIPVYNRPQMVKRAIRSVLNQTEVAHEVLVINDGSTDETVRVLAAFEPQIRVIHQPHQGVSAARNAGIKQAGGDWLALLDSDDEWLPQKLAMARQFHEQNPDYLIFQTEEIWIRNGKRVNPKKKHQKHGGWIFKQSLPLCIVSPSAVVIHRKVFEKVGLFDETFPVCEDYDLWLRVARHFPIGLDRRPGIVKYGGHDDQLSRKYWGMDFYRVKAIEKHLNDPDLPADLRLAALQEIVHKLSILINGYRKRNKRQEELEQKLANYNEQLQRLESKI